MYAVAKLAPFSRFLKYRRHPIISSSFSITESHYTTWAAAIRIAPVPSKAMYLYRCMLLRQHTHKDPFAIFFALKSCSKLRSLNFIRHFHSHVIKLGFHTQVFLATLLLREYVVLCFDDACVLFDEMPVRNSFVWNAMITGYSRSRNVDKARQVFDFMPSRDMYAWSAMITAYINNGKWNDGLSMFREMMVKGERKLDQVIVGTVLTGCAHMGSLALLVGKSVHGFVVKNGWEMNAAIGSLLVDMYGKCQYYKNARRVSDMLLERNVTTWTALICGASRNGYGLEVLSLFKLMQEEGVRPNEMTFTGILNACAQMGLVVEGQAYFKMIEEYGLKLRIQHYGCMIILFGRAGMIDEAYDIIKTMKVEPNFVIWYFFLSACKEHQRFDIAEKVAEQVLRTMKPENDRGVYHLLADLYILNDKLEEAEKVRELMVDKNEEEARDLSFVESGLWGFILLSLLNDHEELAFQRVFSLK